MRFLNRIPLSRAKAGFLVALLCLCTNVTQASGWFTADSINRIQVDEQKVITVVVNNNNNHECGSRSLQIYNSNAAGVEMILAMLLVGL